MNINYFLLVTIILFIVLTVRGYKKGFLRMIVYFGGMIFVLIMAKRATPVIADFFINNTNVYEDVRKMVADELIEKNAARDNTDEDNQVITINSYNLPEILKSDLIINNTREVYNRLLVTVFEDYVSVYLAKILIRFLAFIIVFIVLFIAFKMVLAFTNLISKIPIIKGINKLAGGIVGFLEAYFIVQIVSSFMHLS